MSVTKGNWSVGKTGGTVVSDRIPDDYKSGTGHDDIEYYGGFLICESAKDDDAKLIAAAPDMLEALKDAKRMYEKLQPAGGWQGVYEGICYAIKKATDV